ncbi:P27 family phage terminase small subunit [Mycolicibacterium sp. XJ1819]
MADKPRMPGGLGSGGRKLWREIVDQFGFDPAEVQVLVELCRQIDLVDALAAAVKADGVMIPSSSGGTKLNPAVAELRQGRLAVARLAAALRLPSEDTGRPDQRRAGVRGVYAVNS